VNFKRIVGNLFIAFYLWITLCAFLLTILRIRLFYPKDLVIYSYGMMAPYQSYTPINGDILAEGRTADGTWHVIDLSPYYPVIFGERNAREYFAMYTYTTDPAQRGSSREEFARTLGRLENEKGKNFTAIRISWQQWPAMTDNYHFLKVPAFITTTPMYEVEL
jgi:hypothetical protein